MSIINHESAPLPGPLVNDEVALSMYIDWMQQPVDPEVDQSIFDLQRHELGIADVAGFVADISVGIAAQNRELMKENEELLLDSITGAGTRKKFMMDFPPGSELPANTTLLMIDVAGLQGFNNGEDGHRGGDVLLKSATVSMSAIPNVSVYRTGGDEFAVVCEGDVSEEQWAEVNAVFHEMLKAELGCSDEVLKNAYLRAGKHRDSEAVVIGHAAPTADKTQTYIRALLKASTIYSEGRVISMIQAINDKTADNLGFYSTIDNPLNAPLLATDKELSNWMETRGLSFVMSEKEIIVVYAPSENSKLVVGRVPVSDR